MGMKARRITPHPNLLPQRGEGEVWVCIIMNGDGTGLEHSFKRLDESIILRRGPDAHPDAGQQAASQQTNDHPFRRMPPPPLRTDLTDRR